mgnify:CR=1 FL=1
MNRMDLVEKIAEKNAISKAEANRILGTVIEEVMAAVKAGESLTLVGFGTFKSGTHRSQPGHGRCHYHPGCQSSEVRSELCL